MMRIAGVTMGATLAALGPMLGSTLGGCDSNARFIPNQVKFSGAGVVTAYPAVLEGGKLVKQCGAKTPAGYLVNAVLISTPRRDKEGIDRDRSIRPNDVIQGLVVQGTSASDVQITPSTVDLTVSCIESQDKADAVCAGGTGAATLSSVSYVDHGCRNPTDTQPCINRSTARDRGHNLLILMDFSGSTTGFVDGSSKVERNEDDATTLPTEFAVNASDPNDYRFAAIKLLLSQLNDADEVGVLAFGEPKGKFLRTPCYIPEVSGITNWDEKLDICFGLNNREVWNEGLSNKTGTNNAKSEFTGWGRSNLWSAVNAAYGWLRDRNDRSRTNHILVLTDGPDTCNHGQDFTPCSKVSECTLLPGLTTRRHEDLLAQVKADAADPNAARIHVHFIEFDSHGYVGPDPRQVEVACETDGLYQFINSTQISSFNPVDFQRALEDASLNVRYTLMGYWQLATADGEIGLAAKYPVGDLYALGGLFEVKKDSRLLTTSKSFDFTASSTTTWDRRLVVAKSCDGPGDCCDASGCATTADETACHVVCSADTGLCPGSRAGLSLPNGLPCAENGTNGECCSGSCPAQCTDCN
jgi:hypothetical protein